MEWNSEHTQLQLIYVTGTAQSKLNLLGLFARSRTFMTKCPHASISKARLSHKKQESGLCEQKCVMAEISARSSVSLLVQLNPRLLLGIVTLVSVLHARYCS